MSKLDVASSINQEASEQEQRPLRHYWVDWTRSMSVLFVIMVHSLWNAISVVDIWTISKQPDAYEYWPDAK